jgi:hypothetical protein
MTAVTGADSPGSPRSLPGCDSTGATRPLVGLAWDAGISVVGFYALHILGASDWAALLHARL